LASVSIVGSKSAHAINAPPSQYLTHLESLIQGLGLGRDVIINGAGESLVPGPSQAWTPETVADFVNSGGVWIEWCGIPMYYQVSVDGAFSTLGVSGFQAFAQKAGYPWLDQETWQVPSFGNSFPFSRGYVAQGSQAGVYLPVGTFVQPGGVLGIGGGSVDLSSDGYFAMMALHAPRTEAPDAGIFVYAVYINVNEKLFPLGTVPFFVPAGTIASFLAAVARGDAKMPGATILHAPYTVTTPRAPTGGGPSSPYQQGSTGPGIAVVNGQWKLLREMSGLQVAAEQGVTFAALARANPDAVYMHGCPSCPLKAGTILHPPRAAAGKGRTQTPSQGGGGTKAPSSPLGSLPEWAKVGVVAVGGAAVGGAAFLGARAIETRYLSREEG